MGASISHGFGFVCRWVHRSLMSLYLSVGGCVDLSCVWICLYMGASISHEFVFVCRWVRRSFMCLDLSVGGCVDLSCVWICL